MFGPIALFSAAVATAPTAAFTADLVARLECERLSAEYAAAVDANDPAALANVFAPDGVWTLRDVPQRGRAAIAAFMAGFAKTKTYTSRHVTTNVLIRLVDADHATGTALVQLYRYDPADLPAGAFAPTALGTFTDSYVRTASGWKFASRRLDAVVAKR